MRLWYQLSSTATFDWILFHAKAFSGLINCWHKRVNIRRSPTSIPNICHERDVLLNECELLWLSQSGRASSIPLNGFPLPLLCLCVPSLAPGDGTAPVELVAARLRLLVPSQNHHLRALVDDLCGFLWWTFTSLFSVELWLRFWSDAFCVVELHL